MQPISVLFVMFSVCLTFVGCGAGEYVEEEVIERSAVI